MATPAQEGRTTSQWITIGLTAVSAVLLLVSSILVVTQLDPARGDPMTNAAPGFVQFALLALVVIGMWRRQKLFYLGALGLNGIFFLLGLGAFAIRPAAFDLPWFPVVLGVNLALEAVIVYFAWRTLREM